MFGPFTISAASAMDRLALAVERTVDGETFRNMVLHVDAPRLDLRGTWAGGTADEREGREMRADRAHHLTDAPGRSIRIA